MHREWDLAKYWQPKALNSDSRDTLASFPGLWDVSPGIQHCDPTSWDLHSLLLPQEEAYDPLQGDGSTRWNPRLHACLSFLKVQPHRIFCWGSECIEQQRSWVSKSGSASRSARSMPRPQRFWHPLSSLPLGPTHEMCSVCCLSCCGLPSIHPSQILHGRCSWLWSICCPSLHRCRRQPAQAEVGGGWHGKKQGDDPGKVICVRFAERHQMQKASLIMAIQHRSITAFLILQNTDRKYTTQWGTDGARLQVIRSFKGECGQGKTYGAGSCSSTCCWLCVKFRRHCLCLPHLFTSSPGEEFVKIMHHKIKYSPFVWGFLKSSWFQCLHGSVK